MEKQYNHLIAEKQAQQLWREEKTYSAANNPGPQYTIDTPPPTVSGSLHIGHIFSYTQTDIIARYKRMQGFSVFYPFGFDDNGLPTERYVEKKLEISAHRMLRSEFIKLCLAETQQAAETFKQLWQRMGLSVDWDICYSTISDKVRAISQESFLELLEKGYVYRRYEPSLYCTTCRTSVAQAELDDEMRDSFFNDIVFTDKDGRDLIVGTTRPELLYSCVALLFNPNDNRYKHLEGTLVTTPIFNQKVLVLADDQVSIEKGTGLVMCCTFGDKTDIEWYKKYKLSYKPSIGLDGIWLPETGILAGLRVHAARETIINALKEKNLLIKQIPIKHAVNVHERCKKEIEYLSLPQWFLNILEYKEIFLKLGDDIEWYPAFMKTRYKDWVAHLGWDWCLSRQRFFGIPFPVWHCLNCNAILLPNKSMLPLDPQETAFPGGICTNCQDTKIVPDTDVMDTWNTSSLTPYILYAFAHPEQHNIFEQSMITQQFLPMSMRPQAHDIIRTWAFDTIVKTYLHHRTIPWKNIIISGHVLSGTSGKLSKSKSHNALAPENLLQTYSADAIRYWTASASLGQDVAFSDNQLKIGARLITKLWNAFFFTHIHTAEILPTTPKPENLGAVNEWIFAQADQTFEQYQHYFVQNEFSLALQQAEKFFWSNFCDNYLELIKDQLFKPELYSPEMVAATRWTLYTLGLRILQLYAPFTPHITEQIYQELYKHKLKISSVHQTRFEKIQNRQNVHAENVQTIDMIIELISLVRKLKTEQQLSLKTELGLLSLYSNNKAMLNCLRSQEQLIKGITHAHALVYNEQALTMTSNIEKSGETYTMHVGL